MHNTPDECQFLMVDPKRVELVQYNMVPHLATSVIVDASKAMVALKWLNAEMDDRYRKLAAAGARNIETYNKSPKDGHRLPYMVLIIDELADLMMAQAEEVEPLICRLAQLARATGIHLVVATQRPSVDVITGVIKANFPPASALPWFLRWIRAPSWTPWGPKSFWGGAICSICPPTL